MTGTRTPGIAETVASAIAWAVLCLGCSVLLLTTPAYTATLSRSLDVASSAGIPAAEVASLSDAVRALVADASYDPLPATWGGAPAFDEAAVSHLLDVRTVISAARLATAVTGLLLALYVGAVLATHRLVRLLPGMRLAAWILIASVAVAVAAAFADFEWLFARFHSLFFAGGTWLFPSDSLLIRLFPEPFWIASGACWAVLTVLAAAGLWVTARRGHFAFSAQSASRTAENV